MKPLRDFQKNEYLKKEKWSEKKQNFRDGVEDGSFWCFLCSTMFFDESALRDHIAEHGVSKIFRHNFEGEYYPRGAEPDLKCFQCSRTFSNKEHLTRHTESVHYKEDFSCPDCGKSFSRKDNYKIHKATKHEQVSTVAVDIDKNVQLFGCEVCGKSFSKEDTLKHHKKTHIVKNQFECTDCGSKFSFEKNLRRHTKEAAFEDGSPVYSCGMCDKYFCTGKLLGAHINSSHTNFPCPICKEVFTNKQNLKRHIGKRKAVSCCHCDQVFCNQKRFKEHMNSQHVSASVLNNP